MENNHLKTFEVSGFKKFTDLKIDNIGQFNLIVGDNNAGKTSILEALLFDENLNNFLHRLRHIFSHRNNTSHDDLNFSTSNFLDVFLRKHSLSKRIRFELCFNTINSLREVYFFDTLSLKNLSEMDSNRLKAKTFLPSESKYVARLKKENGNDDICYSDEGTDETYSPIMFYNFNKQAYILN